MTEARSPKSTQTDEFWSKIIQSRIADIQSSSPRDSTNVVEDARRVIDDELDAMHRAICRLRTHRNALSPISSLPSELLARVFQFSAIEMPPKKNHRTSPGPLGWIHLTHVCKHWRAAALNFPSLWEDVNSEIGDEWLALLLARSKSAPISLSVSEYEHVHLFAKHLSHTKQFLLSAATDILRKACPLLVSPAPILSSLTFLAAYSKEEYWMRSNVVLPGDVFAGHTPALSVVSLDGVSLPWNSHIFTNLTSLEVRNRTPKPSFTRTGDPAQDRTDPSSYDHLLDALARMPNLVTLSLWRCLPSRPQGHPARKDTAALSFLQELAIEGAPVECIDIVKYLRVPASCMLNLTCDEDWAPGTPVPIGDLAPFFAASFQRTGKPLLQDLLLFDEMYKSAIFQLGRTPYAPDIGHRSVDSRIDIDSHMFIELPIPPSLEPMETMCAMLPLDALCTLSVNIEHAGWSAASWLAAFGRCSALEHVYLEGDSNVVQFFKALLRPADGGPAPPNGAFLGPDQWFLRSLRSITMSDINSSHMVDGPDTQGIMLIDYLKACLQRRAGYVQRAIDGGMVEGVDGRLSKLCINASSILKDHVSGLADFVQEIDWDEAENQFS